MSSPPSATLVGTDGTYLYLFSPLNDTLIDAESGALVRVALVESTAMHGGLFCPEARVVGAPPPSGTFITVPSLRSTQ